MHGRPADGAFDLWLIENRPAPGHTTLYELQDQFLMVGSYEVKAGGHTLSVTLDGGRFAAFLPDRAFVVRHNQTPLDSFVLTGSGTIFDRLMRWKGPGRDHEC